MAKVLKLRGKVDGETASAATRGGLRPRVHTTLGDLIAAAFDAVGAEVKDVARLLSSEEIRRTLGRRIVLTP